jgi:bacillithiol biosynthesis deacetylase BshB2
MIQNERHVLVVFPHPDDEAFGCAGTISLFTKAGIPVTYACGTLGEMGRNMGKPFFANRETLPLVREKELREACHVMGIKDLRLMGLRDKTIEFEDPEQIADRIGQYITELNPSLILTHYPGYAVHPDHDALGAATILAVSRLPKSERPVVYCKAFAKNTKQDLGEADVVIDVSSVLDTKIAAIRAHRSQTEGMFARIQQRMEQDPQYKAEYEHQIRNEYYYTYKFND